jgi:hypothetical protein
VSYTGFYTSAAVAELSYAPSLVLGASTGRYIGPRGRAHNWELLINKTRRRQLEG